MGTSHLSWILTGPSFAVCTDYLIRIKDNYFIPARSKDGRWPASSFILIGGFTLRLLLRTLQTCPRPPPLPDWPAFQPIERQYVGTTLKFMRQLRKQPL
jgi:hypothetical protein